METGPTRPRTERSVYPNTCHKLVSESLDDCSAVIVLFHDCRHLPQFVNKSARFCDYIIGIKVAADKSSDLLKRRSAAESRKDPIVLVPALPLLARPGH